ncbi:Coiled-coil domain-containing protein [Schistosoma japonicum]|nr:Coiled-coil domain-containing protein [Schistosoma japonicum]
MDCGTNDKFDHSSSYSVRDLPRSEIEERLRFYQIELDKKDELIRQMTKLTTNIPVMQHFSTSDTQTYSHEKFEEIRMKVEKLQHTITENKEMMHEKNITINELRTECDAIRLENVDHLKRIEELENLLVEESHKIRAYKQTEDQQNLVIKSLQDDSKIKTSQFLDLRYQHKVLVEKYESKIQAEKASHEELENYLRDQANLLECEAKPQSCILKLTDLLRSLSDNKEQVKRQGDTIEAYEFEQRASRETISRLSGEVNKEQTLRQAAENSEREIKQELEKIETAYKRSEGCIHLLEERVNSLTQSLQAARNDAVEREKQLHKITKVEAMFQSKVVDNNLPNQSSKLELEKYHWNSDDLHEIQKFIDTMVSWLSFPQADKLSSLFNAAYTDIESELNNLREERLDYNSNFNMLKERITFLEEHKASDSTLIDELRNERDRLHYHLCKLAQILKIDEPIADLGAEILGDALSVRLTQLQQGETEKQTNQRIQISRLQKELRETKDRAESLDLQVGVMRRRLIEAQENRHQTVLPASATPMTLATSEKERRKLIKQLENVKELESNLRQEIVMLKARLLESSQTKLAQMSISKALRAAQNKIDELGSICESRDNELKKLTTELNESRKHSNIELENQNEELLKLRQEINHLQTLLNSSQKSEEHLLEFRKLVAIYLGLDNEQLTIPDYEILTHLDRLVSANQSQAANAVATERAVDLLTGNIRSSK